MNFIIFQFRRFLTFLTDAFLFPFSKIRDLWSDAHRGRAMIFGLPALVVAMIGIVAVFVALGSQSRFLEHYENARKNAEQEQQWNDAIVYMRKIMQLRPNDDATKFELAQILKSDDREETAESNRRIATSILLSLSPMDEPRYSKAHYWHATQCLNYQDRRFTEQYKRELADKQLMLALDSDPDNTDALILRAEQILIPQREYGKALEIYESLFDEYVGYFVKIAELNNVLGHPEKAKPFIRDALAKYESFLEQEPDNIDYLRRLANANAMLGQHDNAVTALLTAIDKAEKPLDRKQLQKVLSNVYLAQAQSLVTLALTDPAAQREYLDFLISAYRADPESESARIRLSTLGFSTQNNASAALEVYDPRDNPKEASDISLQIAGTYEVTRGDRLLGIRLLELAIQHNPRNHRSLNNLAFTIMDSDTERALSLATQAIGTKSDAPQYYDTRGNIYMRMGEWAKATNDLEQVIVIYNRFKKLFDNTNDPQYDMRKIRNDPNVFDALVECYKQQGMVSSAASYEKKADEARGLTSRPVRSSEQDD